MRLQKGFTLIELVVGIALMLLIGSTVTPMLLSHVGDAKIATFSDTLFNVDTAFKSYYSEQMIEGGPPSGSNILDEIVSKNFLSKMPTIKNFVDLKIVREKGSSDPATIDEGAFAYIFCGKSSPSEKHSAFLSVQNLDEQMGNKDQNSGYLQWDDSVNLEELEFFGYLLHAHGVDADNDPWLAGCAP